MITSTNAPVGTVVTVTAVNASLYSAVHVLGAGLITLEVRRPATIGERFRVQLYLGGTRDDYVQVQAISDGVVGFMKRSDLSVVPTIFDPNSPFRIAPPPPPPPPPPSHSLPFHPPPPAPPPPQPPPPVPPPPAPGPPPPPVAQPPAPPQQLPPIIFFPPSQIPPITAPPSLPPIIVTTPSQDQQQPAPVQQPRSWLPILLGGAAVLAIGYYVGQRYDVIGSLTGKE